ncbi:MAG: EAL domain-containing protein [Thalassotalea sp.]
MLPLLEKILKTRDITCVFQPIFNVEKNNILGYEALSRGPINSELYRPDVLFSTAAKFGLLSELELLCREIAICCFAELKLVGKLFINISPMVILESKHPQGETKKLVEKVGLTCQQVVIELSEKFPASSSELLTEALYKYREYGFNVAIDDLGAGYSGLKQWSELRPDIVKIDRYFIENCHQDSFKRKFLKAIFDLAESANAEVIAEGIECQEELALLRQLGMVYAQGFYLARPAKNPVRHFPFNEQFMPLVRDKEAFKVHHIPSQYALAMP